MARGRIFVGNNDTLIELVGLTNDATDAIVSDAIVTCVLVDYGTQLEVPGVAWPLTLNGQGGGLYQGIIDKAVQIQAGLLYDLKITAAAPGGLDQEWHQDLKAQLQRR